MKLWRVLPLILAACSVDLEVPEGTVVECDSDAQCPDTGRCNPLKRACDFETGRAAPSLAFASTGDSVTRAATTLTFAFDALDSNAPPVGDETATYAIAYSTNGETWCPATVSGDAPAIRAEASRATLTWDAIADADSQGACALAVTQIPASGDDGATTTAILAFRADVRLRVTATDSSGETSTTTSLPFAIGNDAPTLRLDTVTAVFKRASPLTYTLTDTSLDDSELDVQFRVNDDPVWYRAQLRGSTTGLVGDPVDAATTRLFVWDADAAMPIDTSVSGGVGKRNVRVALRARAVERVLTGIVTYGAWSDVQNDVSNQTAPVVGSIAVTSSEPGYATGVARITYQVLDFENDAVDVRVEYGLASSGPFFVATPYPTVQHSGTHALASRVDSPPEHTFVWNVQADLARRVNTVFVRVTAADDGGVGPTATTTVPFPVGLNDDTTRQYTTATTANYVGTASRGTFFAIADFTGDGRPDYVIAPWGSDVEVFSAAADGTPGTPILQTASPTLSRTVAMRVADLNKDGRADIIARDDDEGLRIAFGSPSSLVFQAALASSSHSEAHLGIGDFDCDGDEDIAYHAGAYPVQDLITILRNNGSGGFTTSGAPTYATGPDLNGYIQVYGMSAGDFDGDGCDDLVYALRTAQGTGGEFRYVPIDVRVHFGVATQTGLPLTTPPIIAASGNATLSSNSDRLYAAVETGRVFDSGRDALFFADQQQEDNSRLQLLTYADGAFTVRDQLIDVPLIDILSPAVGPTGGAAVVGVPERSPTGANLVALYGLDAKSGRLQRLSPLSTSVAYNIAFRDVNGDGHADLVMPLATAIETRLWRDPATSPMLLLDTTLSRTIPSGHRAIFVGDVDGDTFADAYALDGGNETPHVVAKYRATTIDGAATYTLEPVSEPTPLSPANGPPLQSASDYMYCADLDGNGAGDVGMIRDVANVYGVLATETPFELASPVYDARGGGSEYRAVGDFNGDGRDELVYSNSNTPNVAMATINAGTLAGFTVTPLTTLTSIDAMTSGDLSDDGRDDLVVFNGTQVDIYFGQTAAPYLGSRCARTITATAAAIGDVNGDGRGELVLVSNGRLRWYRVTSCNAQELDSRALGSASQRLRIVDVNGDGFFDIVGYGGASITYYLGASNGLGGPVNLPITVNAFGLHLDFGDINGDALPELFVSTPGGALTWLINRRASSDTVWSDALAPAALLESSAPALDYFGAPWTYPIVRRRTVDTTNDLVSQRAQNAGFTDRLRRSGIANTLPASATAVSDAWRFDGAFGTDTDSRTGEATLTRPSELYGVGYFVISLPLAGAVDPSKVRVFGRIDTEYELDHDEVLPRTDAGATVYRPVSTWIEVVRDSDNVVTTGDQPRFVVGAGALQIATPSLGVFRAYVVP